jgi:glutamine amidotransferase-like uncharacterized protein
MSFYVYWQNNSGGYFIKNDDVREEVVIEADYEYKANETLEIITERYSECCSCCGERWSNYPRRELETVEEYKEWFKKEGWHEDSIIYYADGKKEIIYKEE